MCHDYTASPPTIPSSVLPATFNMAMEAADQSGQRLTLTSQDGTQFAAYRAQPAEPRQAGIVILPDVRGLFRFYEELAERFASVGVAAIAIDYFGRTAGITPRDEHFDYMPHVMQTNPEQISQDVGAAITHLHSQNPQLQATFTIGFCFGGANSFHQAANHHGLAGVIGFYGSPTLARRGPAPITRISDFTCPVLGFFGGADEGIPPSAIQQFDEALTEVNIPHELVTYPGAPHSFFDRTYAQYQEECADAWRRLLAFIDTNTPRAMI